MTLERCPLQAEAAREFLKNSGAKHRIRVNRDLLASLWMFQIIFVYLCMVSCKSASVGTIFDNT